MSIRINDNLGRKAPKPIDDSMGLWDSGAWRPFNSVSEAYETIKDYAYISLTVPIIVGGEQKDYWFVGGIAESDLVEKTASVDLSQYYTKTDLQTAGSALVHFDNITGVPAFITGVNWDEIGGDQSDIEVGDFANTVGYITSADLPDPLTFENGLRENGGTVKLGLDLGTGNGSLTEPTFLISGDVSTNDIRGVLISEYFTRIVNVEEDSIASYLDLSVGNGVMLGLRNDGQMGTPQYGFKLNESQIQVYDLNNKGLEEADDYSANKTAYSYVTKMMLDAVEAQIPTITTPTLQQVLTAGDTATRGAYFRIPEELVYGGNTVVSIGDYDLVNDGDISTGIRVANTEGGNNRTDIGAFGIRIQGTLNDRALLSSTSLGVYSTEGALRFLSSGPGGLRIAGSGVYNLLSATFQNREGVVAYLDDIPDLTGYATEQWVLDQNYLDSITWGFDVNTGDLTIEGVTNSLDGRWLERETTITSGYGINASGDFSSTIFIEVDTTTLDNRYLRKDISDGNDGFTLTLGGLVAGDTTLNGSVTLSSIGTGTGDEILLYGPGGVIQRKTLSFEGQFGVANSTGTKQFDVDLGTNLRFAGAGDASVSFNASTNTVTITSVPGSGGGGVITSVFGRTTPAIVAETGDYTTAQVTESGNLYFTQARVRATPLTGLSVTNSAITATDNVLAALGKAQGQINARVPTSRQITINGTAGNITVGGGTQDLSANRTWTINLANKGTAGTYTKVTTDAQGRVASGGSLTAGDLPSSVFQTLSTGNPVTMLPGHINISGGNTDYLNSIRAMTMTDAQASLPTNSGQGLYAYTHTTGATGFPSAVGGGILYWRYSGTTAKSGFMIDKSGSGDNSLRYAHIEGDGVVGSWNTIASKQWVATQIPTVPTDYVNTTGNQSGIAGNKAWTGYHIWTPTAQFPVAAGRIGFGTSPGNGVFLQAGRGSTAAQSFILRGYVINGAQLELNEGGINAPVTSTVADGPYYAGGNVVVGVNNTGATVLASTNNTLYLRPTSAASSTGQIQISSSGIITASGLSGSGTQMVVANASGVLSRQAIPAVGVTSVSAGNGMNFSTITGSGAVTMGTPGTLTSSTSNSVSSTSHTHALGETVFIAMGSLGSTNLNDITQAGNGAQTTAAEATLDRNYPIAGGGGTLLSTAAVNNYRTQFFNERAANRMFWRGFNGSAWSAWKEFWHTGNFSPSDYQTNITGGASTITTSNLTTNRALISNGSGKVAVSAVTSTELGYLDGVTSAIQTQLNGKAPTTHTHTWSQLSGGSTGLIPGAGASGTYGSLNISGSKQGYAGIRFSSTDSGATLMVSSTTGRSGMYSDSGWLWAFEGDGTLYEGTVPWDHITGVPAYVPTSRTLSIGVGEGLNINNSGNLPLTSNIVWSIALAVPTTTNMGGFRLVSNTQQTVAANGVTATSGRTYAVQRTSSGQAVVNVPWTNNTYSAGNGLTGTSTFSVGAGSGISVGSGSVAVDSTVIRTTGNQTLGGTKTFTSPVPIAAATAGNHAIRRDQLAGLISEDSNAIRIMTNAGVITNGPSGGNMTLNGNFFNPEYPGGLFGANSEGFIRFKLQGDTAAVTLTLNMHIFSADNGNTTVIPICAFSSSNGNQTFNSEITFRLRQSLGRSSYVLETKHRYNDGTVRLIQDHDTSFIETRFHEPWSVWFTTSAGGSVSIRNFSVELGRPGVYGFGGTFG